MSDWMDHVVLCRPRPLAAVARSGDAVALSLPRSTVTIRRLDAGTHAALLALDTPEMPLTVLLNTAGPQANLDRLMQELGRIYARGAFTVSVRDGERTVCELSATSVTAHLNLALDGHDGEALFRISRFALLRRVHDTFVVDNLATGARLAVTYPELGAVLVVLTVPTPQGALAAQAPALSAPVLGACLHVMQAGGVIGPVNDALLAEDRDADLLVREPQDLLLHNHSRMGLSADAIGGTYRHVGAVPPLPAISLRHSPRSITLPPVDVGWLVRTDMPLAAAMEHRRSRREWADRPLALAELGEFLYRVFRITAFAPRNPADPLSYETSMRLLPSAGAAHDLEVYVAAGRIADLNRGLYHYDPVRHVLAEITSDGPALSMILGAARQSSACAGDPPAVVVLASRFGRLAWKYEGIAYASTLKNVGVAYTAMYLAATAMGLAGCALGSGDSAAFSMATGFRPYVESSVGEFMIGPACGDDRWPS